MSKHAVVEQLTARPTAKVTAAGLGAGAAAVVLGLADLAQVVELPPFVSALLTGVSAFVAGYLKKTRASEA